MEAEDREFLEAAQAGLRRAATHFMRAGYEVLSGVIAFLEEVGSGDDDGEVATGPIRIVLDEDEDDEGLRLSDAS